MKFRIILLTAGLLVQIARGQLLTEHFDYNNGSLGGSGVGDAVWTGGDSPSSAIIVTNTAALTNANLSGVSGKGVQMTGGTFKKRNAGFTSQSSGTVYV